jgi:hypothetical protein
MIEASQGINTGQEARKNQSWYKQTSRLEIKTPLQNAPGDIQTS